MTMLLDDEFLDKARDPRYSSAWVGIAVRWQLSQQDNGDKVNLIDGLKIELSSAELKLTLVERHEHHKAKAAFYASQVSAMGKQGIEQQHATNDPVSSLKASQRSHEERTAFFRFLADHVIPDSTYGLTEHDLTRLELLSRYL